jgi:homoserine kinase type II
MLDPALSRFLETFPRSARPIGPVLHLGPAGGLSGSRFHRFDSPRGPLVAHAWPPPPDGPGASRLGQIHRWVKELDSLPYIPRAIADRNGQDFREIDGRLWELRTWLPGQAQNEPGRERASTAFAGLGAVHAIWQNEAILGRSPGLDRRLREMDGLISGRLDALERAAERADWRPALGHLACARPCARAVRDMLAEALRLGPIPLQPCLRDVRSDHVLFTGDTVTGLIDFGAMAVDSPAGDLARLMSDWRLGLEARGRAVQSYAEAAGLAPPDAWLIRAFETSGALLGGCRWITWTLLDRRSFPPGAAEERLRRCTAALAASMPSLRV